MELQDFPPIFGEPKLEWLNSGSLPVRRFVFYVHNPNPSHLRFCVTDFHSNTWEAIRSVPQLQDMRDDIGIGGDMSEFLNYLITSLKLGDVKLRLEGHWGKEDASTVATHAKLSSQKSKGMPVFSIPLTKLVDSAASEAVASLSFGLFNSLKDMECSLIKEQEHSLQLTNMISSEKEKYESIQSHLGQYTKKQKLQNMNASNSPDKSVHNIGSTKVANRVVPAHRRAKTRGALLQDSEDDTEQERSLQSTKISDEKEKKQELHTTITSVNKDELQKSPDKPVNDISSTKVTNRVMPVHRRARTRGALLQDNEDDGGR
ncbi:uncharacterized protein LOC111017494 isoform X2 [Momordica charantia]|uniref:Uncharacterized protein LOC111017494 isoform X2 n=1 Tax=Momordica charantia TaxID=3673 RepID=A0A6J1D6X2_MOMCH|nr:uncharacterized protein LOC111017494 isoform X2 [Momordica charantia]